MIRAIVLIMLATVQGLATAASQSAPAPVTIPCESRTTGGDYFEFTCPLHASAVTQRFYFKANFAGGHDDTRASLSVMLNDMPLLCDEGSKTSLFAEDGDVSLECKFTIKQNVATTLILGVKLLWSHAQYQDAELVRE